MSTGQVCLFVQKYIDSYNQENVANDLVDEAL